jgi:hypothetical protein
MVPRIAADQKIPLPPERSGGGSAAGFLAFLTTFGEDSVATDGPGC